MRSQDVRRIFLEYFKKNGHTVVQSSPVVPLDDPTLIFANAGMNQFKDIFLGRAKADYKRAASTQKCIRVSGKHNDLDEVGRDGFHHTFFEMLGNWSFGDYFKEGAIKFAWELLTEGYNLAPEKLWVTVYKDDDESYNIWKDIMHIPESRTLRCGDKDNFWEMGDTGPCGPCSEIHYDTGSPAHGIPNDNTDRFIEIWNLVFMEFYRDTDGEVTKLPMQSVDTGMGFERLCSILQGCVGTNYHTDLFMPIIRKIEEFTGVDYDVLQDKTPFWVIADHIRSLTFALADGAMPSSEGRGYVLRRILRRAARFSRNLGMREPLLYRLSSVVIDTMGDAFPELNDKASFVASIIKGEEERFEETLDNGLKYFDKITQDKSAGYCIPGDDVFRLYDTFGFPVDLTSLIAEERGLTINLDGFHHELEQQRERARAATTFKGDMTLGSDEDWNIVSVGDDSEFIGYENIDDEVKIRKWRELGDGNIALVLDRTPFYAESGGQVGDSGIINGKDFSFNVVDTRKIGSHIFHIGQFVGRKACECSLSDDVSACVHIPERKDTARNHTATHLLHYALRKVIGDHVHQSGSLVEKDRLRFDYTHYEKPSVEQLRDIERIVNSEI